MICAFDRNGFLEPNHIFSGGRIEGVEYEVDYIAYRMIITKYSTIFRGDNNQWQSDWIYPRIWSGGGGNSDFVSYIHYIKDPAQYVINIFIRKYMEKLNIRYAKYQEYMRNYLALNLLE